MIEEIIYALQVGLNRCIMYGSTIQFCHKSLQ